MEPSSNQDAGGGIAVQEPVDDVRVSGDETGTAMEKALDEDEGSHEEKEGQYKVKDLVWGKVKSYPWWPGQIFDPSASTDEARKYSNKKGFLVAYFGDQSFAWIEASKIKPFRKNFFKMEKQSNSKAFCNAVSCALDEVSRRVEFGLACSCLSEEAYGKIKSQVFVNSGIKEEACRIDGGDSFSTVATFKAANIVQSVQDLAREHFDGISRLEVFSVRAQLMAFYRWKGYNQLSAQSLLEGLDSKLEDNSEVPLMEKDKMAEDAKPDSVGEKVSSKKRKLNNTEVPLMEKDKMVEDAKPDSVGEKVSSKKRKLNNSEVPFMEKDKMVEDKKPDSVGEKVSSKKRKLNACDDVSRKEKHVRKDEMISSKKDKPLAKVTPNGRSSGPSRENKNKNLFGVGDSICRIARQISESPLIFKKDSQKVKETSMEEKHIPKSSRKSVPEKNSNMREKNDEKCVEKSEENGEELEERVLSEPAAVTPDSSPKKSKENSATALILKFTNSDSIPSVTNLNEIFSRYGAVIEAETEVLKKNNCAKVVFESQSDAETAFSSAGKFSLFGPSLISYRLDYSPTPRKIYTSSRKKNKKDGKSVKAIQSEE